MTKRFLFFFNPMRCSSLIVVLATCLVIGGCKESAKESKTPDPRETAADTPGEPREGSDMSTSQARGLEAMAPEAEGSEATSPRGEEATKSGTVGAHLGKAFTLETFTDIETIAKDPKAFEGKTVRVQGLMVTYCHCKKSWFALKSSKESMGAVRVVTAPAFSVPSDVKDGVTTAVAEGVVELKTVSETFAKHLARDHGLFGGEPDRVSGPQHWVHLQATGASFQ